MLNDDTLMNALLKHAALKQSAEAERRLQLPWADDTARLRDLAYAAVLARLKERGMFSSGLLIPGADYVFESYLGLRQHIANDDPAQMVNRIILKGGAFTYYQRLERQRRDDQARH